MARFHDVSIYSGTSLVTTSTKLEVAARSPFLHELLTSIRMCDSCKEPTTLIFPAEDETQKTLQEMFKSSFPVIYDTGDIIINDIRSTTEIESFESAGHAGQIFIQNTNGNIIEDEAYLGLSGGPVFHREEGGGEGYKVKRRKKLVTSNQETPEECNICHKQFKTKKYLASHLALCHFKKELKPFLDEEQLQCRICYSKHTNIYNLRVHVASAHKKLEEVMKQAIQSSKQDCYRRSLVQLDLDLSSDEDAGVQEVSLGDEMDYLFSDSDEVQCLE